MKTYVHYDLQTRIVQGIYYEGGSANPEPHNEVTLEQVSQIVASGCQWMVGSDDQVTPVITTVSTVQLHKRKLAAINLTAEKAVAAITDKYPPFEINTFDAQEREARAWLLDNNMATPTLSIIALGRGIAMADLVSRVIEKADLFRPFVASVIARRQALEDQLDAIDLTAVDAAARIAALDETQLLNTGW